MSEPQRTVMPFGKHKGEFLGDIPLSYLIWVYENTELRGKLKEDVKATIDMLDRSQ